MSEAPTYVDLYAHSLMTLLSSARWLPMADARVARELADRATFTLDTQELSQRSRRDLGIVQYLLRKNSN